MANSNLGFTNLFNLQQPFSPTLARQDFTPGMVNLQQSPMPTPAGGAAPGMASTANGIGGGSVVPGAMGAPSMAQAPQAGFGGQMPPSGMQQATSWPGQGSPMQQLPGQTQAAQGMTPQLLNLAQQGVQMMNGGRPSAAQQGLTLAQLLQQYNVSGLLGG